MMTCLCLIFQILGTFSLMQLSAWGISGGSLLDLIREEFAPHLMNTYKNSIHHLSLTALQGLDTSPDCRQFIGENSFVLHTITVCLRDQSSSEPCQLNVCSKHPLLQKFFKLAALSTKISNLVLFSVAPQELISGWQCSISTLLELEGGPEAMARSFVSQFVHAIRCTTEDCLESSADCQESISLKKHVPCIIKRKLSVSIGKLLDFLKHYSLMETVGLAMAGCCNNLSFSLSRFSLVVT
jgi:hypothetical protein